MAKPQQRYAFQYYTFPDADPDVVAEFLETLIDAKKEHVTHDEVLAAARPSDSPIHSCFTWNDVEAADRYRKFQARRLVRSIYTANAKGEPTRTRAFWFAHHPDHDGKKVLLTRKTIMSRPETRNELKRRDIIMAQRQVDTWLDRLGDLPALKAARTELERLRKVADKELLHAV